MWVDKLFVFVFNKNEISDAAFVGSVLYVLTFLNFRQSIILVNANSTKHL